VRLAPGAAFDVRLISRSEAETEALGESLGPLLEPGDVIALVGPLGAGKTRFVAGLARGLAAKARVRSPTFTLVNEYRGRIPLLHVDLYRVETRDLPGLALEERFGDAAIVVEWGDQLPSGFTDGGLRIQIEQNDGGRVLHCESLGARGRELLNSWRSKTDPSATDTPNSIPGIS